MKIKSSKKVISSLMARPLREELFFKGRPPNKILVYLETPLVLLRKKQKGKSSQKNMNYLGMWEGGSTTKINFYY